MYGQADSGEPARTAVSKRALRKEIIAARRSMGGEARTAAATAVTEALLAHPWLTEATTVAAYVSIGTEPDTRALLERLRRRSVTVLLPVLLADADLDWASYEGPASLEPGAGGLPEPAGTRLGVHAIRGVDVAVVPALAVDQRGVRLGRGGGSYDRVLARFSGGTRTAVPLYEGELVAAVPAEPHDRRVRAVVTPLDGVREL